MKNILIINGHPNKQSYNYALSDAYIKGAATTNAKVTVINIVDLTFEVNLNKGYQEISNLEPDLVEATKLIKQANHLVWIFPLWWYSYPAIMKGFIDRTFLPGEMYKFHKGKQLPEQLLKGKTARIITTSDTPNWYNKLLMKEPAIKQLKKGTLEFCGVKPVKVTSISPIKGSSLEFRKKWIDKIYDLGKALA